MKSRNKKAELENLLNTGPASERSSGELYTCHAKCRNVIAQAIEILEFRVGIEDFGWYYGPVGVLQPDEKGGETPRMSYFNDANTAIYVKFKNLDTGLVFDATAGAFDLEEENDQDVMDVAIAETLRVYYKESDLEMADWNQVK